MTFRRTVWLLTLVTLLFSIAAPQAFASWQCEGRTCGTSPWYCCCLSPENARHRQCETTSAPRRDGATACPAGCNCVLTVRAVDPARTPRQLFQAPLQLVAFIPAPAIPEFRLPFQAVARSVEERGPPLRRPILTAPSLRGPPAPISSLATLSSRFSGASPLLPV